MSSTDLFRLTVAVHTAITGVPQRLIDARHDAEERGEGVISAAIAVLIMAVIGAAMYASYRALFDKTSDSVSANVDKISG